MPLPTIAGRVRRGRQNGSSGKRSARLPRLKSPVASRRISITTAPSFILVVEAALDATAAKSATRQQRHTSSKRNHNQHHHLSIPNMVALKPEKSTIMAGKPEVQRLSSSLVNFWGGGTPPPTAPSTSSSNHRPSPVNITTSTDGTNSSTDHSSSTSVRKLASRFERKHDTSHSTATSSSSSSGSYCTATSGDEDDDNENDDESAMESQQRQQHYRERLTASKRSCHRRLFTQSEQQQQHASTSYSGSSSGILQSSYAISSAGDVTSGSSLHDTNNTTGTTTSTSTPESSSLDSARSAAVVVDTPVTTTATEAVIIQHDASATQGSTSCSSSTAENDPSRGSHPEAAEDSAASQQQGGESRVDLSSSSSQQNLLDLAATGEASDSFEQQAAAIIAEETNVSDPTVTRAELDASLYENSALVGDSFSAMAEDEAETFDDDDDGGHHHHHDESTMGGDTTMLDQEDPYELQANKSEFSEGILYNLIHAAQAAVEQDSQEQQCIEVAPAVGKVKDAPSVLMGGTLGSVVGESSTITRSGETVLRSNRSDRGLVPFGNTTPTELPEEPADPPAAGASTGAVGYALADDDDDGIKTTLENQEYLSESSISGTESATSGDNSDLDNFLGNFMTDFNQQAALSGMRCASTNQVVESEKPTMPSLFEIRKYLKEEMNPMSPCTNDDDGTREDHAQFYSKGVLGDHLSDATSQVDSQLDSVTWNTEGSEVIKQESTSDPPADYAPSQWFDTIQKTLFSMAGAAEPTILSTAESPAKTSDGQNESSASFSKSFDTLDEIMQALQGAPPLTTRARKVQERLIPTKRSVLAAKTSPTKKHLILSQISSAERAEASPPTSNPTFSSTPLTPPASNGSSTEDSPEKPLDTTRSPENSVLESSLEESHNPVKSGANATRSENSKACGSATARKQIDEVYSVLHKSRAETSSDSIRPSDVRQTEATEAPSKHDEPKGNLLDACSSSSPVPMKRTMSKRRAPKISVTTGSGIAGRSIAVSSSAADENAVAYPMIANVPSKSPVSLPVLPAEESPDSQRDALTLPVESEQQDASSPHIGTADAAPILEATDLERSETNLTFLGQEWELNSENCTADVTSGDTDTREASKSIDAAGTVPRLLQEAPNDNFQGFIAEQEQSDINDISTIKNVNSSLTSECSGLGLMSSPPRVTRFVSGETAVAETLDSSQRVATPTKVLKRLGSILFARGGKNISSSSDSSDPVLNRSTESSTREVPLYTTVDSSQSGGRPYSSDGECSAPDYAAIDCSTSDPDSSGRINSSDQNSSARLDSSGECPSNRKTRQMPMRWLRRSPMNMRNGTGLLDQEDVETKASHDNETRVDVDRMRLGANEMEWNSREPTIVNTVSPPQVASNSRSLGKVRHQKITKPNTETETSWEDFTSAEPFQPRNSNSNNRASGGSADTWTGFSPATVKTQHVMKQIAAPTLRSKLRQVRKAQIKPQAPQWEEFSGSTMFPNNTGMYEV